VPKKENGQGKGYVGSGTGKPQSTAPQSRETGVLLPALPSLPYYKSMETQFLNFITIFAIKTYGKNR